MNNNTKHTDICLILEGTYPYVTGGVSSWTQDLLQSHSNLTFHLLTLVHKKMDLTLRYEIPNNVTGVTNIFIQELPRKPYIKEKPFVSLFKKLEGPLLRLQSKGGLAEISEVINLIKPYKNIGKEILLDSQLAWETLLSMYYKSQPKSSFLDYFWTWRGLFSSLFSLLLTKVPSAKVYHAVSTGFAGLYAAYAHLETGRPAMLTEHGIYTNERWIEIEMSDWLYEIPQQGLCINNLKYSLKDLWINTFVSYSKACYEACNKIITLYEGNQEMQIEDGAEPERLEVIPNGIDYNLYAGIKKENPNRRRPTIALIGRVVPIKDIKTFIRACSIVKKKIPDINIYILGPTTEDSDYFFECTTMVNHLNLQNTITFTGKVYLEDYLGKIDLIVLTSISEAMPIVILEAGITGIPTVATDVGACGEMILGTSHEKPSLGQGGIITPLSNPSATANAVIELLVDKNKYQEFSQTIKKRIKTFYNKSDLDNRYKEIYKKYCSMRKVIT